MCNQCRQLAVHPLRDLRALRHPPHNNYSNNFVMHTATTTTTMIAVVVMADSGDRRRSAVMQTSDPAQNGGCTTVVLWLKYDYNTSQLVSSYMDYCGESFPNRLHIRIHTIIRSAGRLPHPEISRPSSAVCWEQKKLETSVCVCVFVLCGHVHKCWCCLAYAKWRIVRTRRRPTVLPQNHCGM